MFEESVRLFQNMFPNVPRREIEKLLAREISDTDHIVDELLRISNSLETTGAGSSSSHFYLDPPPPYSSVVKKQEAPTGSGGRTRVATRSESCISDPEEVIDDEKLALMLQNEEFLQYLRRDSTFMWEVYGREYTRPSHTPMHYTRHTYGHGPATPEGPLVTVAATSIPDGPLVDYNYNDSSTWGKWIGGKLSHSRSHNAASVGRPGSSLVKQDFFYANGGSLAARLKTMSRNSKLMLSGLARRFFHKTSSHLLPVAGKPEAGQRECR